MSDQGSVDWSMRAMDTPRKILCVLRDRDEINMFTFFFAHHGLSVQGVTSIEEGLHICLTAPPGLLIVLRCIEQMDDGLRLCQQVRTAAAELAKMPIILGWADMFRNVENQNWETDYQQAFDAGANACFGRVYDITDVLEQVNLLLTDPTLTQLVDRQTLKLK